MQEFRPSTLKEREEYYRREFSLEKVIGWFKNNKLLLPQLYAVDMGAETKIIKDKAKLGKIINLRAVNLKDKLIKHLPEDVYYDRNRYKDPETALKKLNFNEIFSDANFLGQELAFDIDPENIKCSCKSRFPNFCNKCLKKAIENGIKLAEKLEERFKRIGLVYSGRGAHVHVFDKEGFHLTIKEREGINNELKKFAIDPWVSRGKIRLIRMPYSLNGLVSRIALPLSIDEARDFDPVNSEKSLPDFMASSVKS